MYRQHDNEDPNEVVTLLKHLGEFWRGALLKKDDEELGLGLGASAGALHTGAASRAALLRFLEMLAPQLEQDYNDAYGEGGKASFNFTIRKRRSAEEVADERATKAAKAAEKAREKTAKAAEKEAAKAAKAAAKEAARCQRGAS